MTPNDQVLAFIRTYVPYAIGALIAWLLVHNIALPDAFALALTAFAVALSQNVYYLLVRLLESWLPWLGVLLGFPSSPVYIGLSDLWASVVRTGIPTIVGAVLGALAAIGLHLDPQTQAGLIVVLVGVVQALYYGLARAIIHKWPAAAWLLGTGQAPQYGLPA